MNDSRHDCPAPDCPERLPFSILACKRHWFKLPADLRREINAAWRSGNLDRHSRARTAAVDFLEGLAI